MKRYLFLKYLMMIFILVPVAFPVLLLAQQGPVYSFVSFQNSYTSIKNEADKKDYRIVEKQILSPYGQKVLTLVKDQKFYTENLFVFFNEKEEVIFFSVGFILNENQPRRILRDLFDSIKGKLEEKYGKNDNDTLPYYKVIGDRYVVFLHPFYAYSNNIKIDFKDIEKFDSYTKYYDEQVKKLETETINNTVNNF